MVQNQKKKKLTLYYASELLCEHYFGIIPTLCDAVKESIGALLDKREAEAKVDILKSIKRESIADPYTLNHYCIRALLPLLFFSINIFLIAYRYGHHRQDQTQSRET
jgi:hypothetical protein